MTDFPRKYSARTPLPPGYVVAWCDGDEHYHWLKGDIEGPASCHHWDCWRGAWAHYRANSTGQELQTQLRRRAAEGGFGEFAAGVETMRTENDALRTRAETAERALADAQAGREAAELALGEAVGHIRALTHAPTKISPHGTLFTIGGVTAQDAARAFLSTQGAKPHD